MATAYHNPLVTACHNLAVAFRTLVAAFPLVIAFHSLVAAFRTHPSTSKAFACPCSAERMDYTGSFAPSLESALLKPLLASEELSTPFLIMVLAA